MTHRCLEKDPSVNPKLSSRGGREARFGVRMIAAAYPGRSRAAGARDRRRGPRYTPNCMPMRGPRHVRAGSVYRGAAGVRPHGAAGRVSKLNI